MDDAGRARTTTPSDRSPGKRGARAGASVTLAVFLIACGGAPPPAAAQPESGPSSRDTAGTAPDAAPTAPDAPPTSATPSAPPAAADATATAAAGSTPPKQPDSASASPPPPLPEGTTILHIGDSFAGALGIDLNKELEARGVRGILKYETSSYIPTWAWSKDLDKYLWQYKPDLVLITLGANELEVPDPEIRARTIQKLVNRLGGRPCVWVAPPLWEGARDALIPVIEKNSKPCVFLSNAEIARDMPRARDNIHPSMNARRDWAKYVVDWLARHRVPEADRPWEMRADP